MRNRQSGMTFLGLLILVVVVGTWVYAGIRIVPMYLNYMKIANSFEKVKDEFDSNPGTTEAMIRNSIYRYFDVEMVDEKAFSYKDVKVRKSGGTFIVTAAYEDTRPFVSNIYFLTDFEKSVEIQAR